MRGLRLKANYYHIARLGKAPHDLQRLITLLLFYIVALDELKAATYLVEEHSINSIALNSAFVAGAYGADSSFYNPANLSLGGLGPSYSKDGYQLEISTSLILSGGFSFDTANRSEGINLVGSPGAVPSGHYCEVNGETVQDSPLPNKNSCGPPRLDGQAASTLRALPSIFFRSSILKLPLNLRFAYGFSFTQPSSPSTKWGGEGGAQLRNFTVTTMEFSPVASLAWGEVVALGLGLRVGHTSLSLDGSVFTKMNYTDEAQIITATGTARTEQAYDASGWGVGYNITLSARPFVLTKWDLLKNLRLALNYRSGLKLDLGGKIYYQTHLYMGRNFAAMRGYVETRGDSRVGNDLPPLLSIALSQDFFNHRLEVVYERRFWTQARVLDLARLNEVYRVDNLKGLGASFIDPEALSPSMDNSSTAYAANWQDTSSVKIGYSYFGTSYKLMGSLAFDEGAAPRNNFGLLNATSLGLGLGARKALLNDRLDIGLAYSVKFRELSNSYINLKSGSNQVHLFSLGARYSW